MLELLLIILIIFLISQSRRLSSRLSVLEKELDLIKAQQLPAVPQTATEIVAPENVADMGAPEATAEPQEAAADQPQPAADTATTEEPKPVILSDTAASQKNRSFESYIGARWPVWVGGVALAFGGVFLVRYSIEAGLLGPAARLILAALFGAILVGAGELLRRRALPTVSELYANAMIPGALTAAGSVTLLGATFAAYSVYGFLDATTAFALLAAIAFLTIALSLLHGQALAGLGLLAALVVPLLVETEAPSPTALFAFLALTWLAIAAASRIRRWTVVPMLANIGLGLWVLAYAALELTVDPVPPTAALLVAIAGTAFIWPGQTYRRQPAPAGGWRELLKRPPLKVMLSLSVMVALSALAILSAFTGDNLDPLFAATATLAALAGLGGGRRHGLWAAISAAIGALLSIALLLLSGLDYVAPSLSSGQIVSVIDYHGHEVENFLLLGAIFSLVGFAFLKRFRASEPQFSIVWALLAAAIPAVLGFLSLYAFGKLTRDWQHGLYGMAMGAILFAAAEWLSRRASTSDGDTETGTGKSLDWSSNILVAGSFAGLTLTVHALSNGLATTILLSALGFTYLLAAKLRRFPAMPWMMAASMVIIFGRVAWQPTIVGPESLGTTPFLNALLPGYGIPTLLAIVAAWLLRQSDDLRIRNIMQALASLAALITIAVLVRHAMNGGVLDSRTPTLGEQSIYTLVTVGFSAILILLDVRSPSPVFRYGAMLAGVIATINVLSLHVFALNPFFSGENTGLWPFVNLLLLGYLLPSLAYALTAHLAHGRRPAPYVALLATAGALLGFLWATLSVRRFWQGENIARWKGFLPEETYTYSVVWLAIGVALLFAGTRLNSKSLRLASAALVMASVAKVFLIDMANLEGILRALSFIGLGAVLIGIGLFYQRILVNKDASSRLPDS